MGKNLLTRGWSKLLALQLAGDGVKSPFLTGKLTYPLHTTTQLSSGVQYKQHNIVAKLL